MFFFESIPSADRLIVGLRPGGLGFRLDPPMNPGLGSLRAPDSNPKPTINHYFNYFIC